MATITFRGKVETALWMDGTLAYRYIRVPKFERRHCDMPAFREHARFGMFANSDLFPSVLAKIRDGIGAKIKLDAIPSGVQVNTDGFLATVTVEV